MSDDISRYTVWVTVININVLEMKTIKKCGIT